MLTDSVIFSQISSIWLWCLKSMPLWENRKYVCIRHTGMSNHTDCTAARMTSWVQRDDFVQPNKPFQTSLCGKTAEFVASPCLCVSYILRTCWASFLYAASSHPCVVSRWNIESCTWFPVDNHIKEPVIFGNYTHPYHRPQFPVVTGGLTYQFFSKSTQRSQRFVEWCQKSKRYVDRWASCEWNWNVNIKLKKLLSLLILYTQRHKSGLVWKLKLKYLQLCARETYHPEWKSKNKLNRRNGTNTYYHPYNLKFKLRLGH